MCVEQGEVRTSESMWKKMRGDMDSGAGSLPGTNKSAILCDLKTTWNTNVTNILSSRAGDVAGQQDFMFEHIAATPEVGVSGQHDRCACMCVFPLLLFSGKISLKMFGL